MEKSQSFQEGFDDATAWLPPRNEWSKKYMEGWTAGAALQMEEHAPHCGIKDNE